MQSPDADNPIGGDKAKAKARAAVRAGRHGQRPARSPRPSSRQAAAEKLTYSRPDPAQRLRRRRPATTDGWGFFCDYLRRWWDQQPQFGKTADERDDALRRGGYTVVTTLDPAVQKEAAAAVPLGLRR